MIDVEAAKAHLRIALETRSWTAVGAALATLNREVTPDMTLYDWAYFRLQDARGEGAIDIDVSDATISREAHALEALLGQMASAFIDNDLDESD